MNLTVLFARKGRVFNTFTTKWKTQKTKFSISGIIAFFKSIWKILSVFNFNWKQNNQLRMVWTCNDYKFPELWKKCIFTFRYHFEEFFKLKWGGSNMFKSKADSFKKNYRVEIKCFMVLKRFKKLCKIFDTELVIFWFAYFYAFL